MTAATTTEVPSKDIEAAAEVDYVARAQWLRAAVLGANDGLLSTASLMMGVGAVTTAAKAMAVAGIAGMIAGACSMAVGEFVFVHSQRDIEIAHMKPGSGRLALPSPGRAAAASAAAFATGAVVPLAACFVRNYKVRLGVVVVVVSLALLGFGALGALLGKAPPLKSTVRVLLGGWLAMAVTFGFIKLVDYIGL